MSSVKYFSIINFGCKLNIYESESIAYLLSSNGYEITEDHQKASVIIINTCTVTNKTDSKCRYAIRKAKRDNPSAKIVVCGCLVDTDADTLKELGEIDVLITNKNKDKIIDILEILDTNCDIERPFIYNSPVDGSFNFNTHIMSTHSRAFIKIQDGCNNFCSYCKIPFARGRSRSRNYDDIISDIDNIRKTGFHEIILTGINIANYKYDNYLFDDLLDKITDLYPDMRFRLSSIEPQDLGNKFFDVIKKDNICPHFHIPLQSGSDKILKLMNRRYDFNLYYDMLCRIRSVKNNPYISTDIIAGFPSETDDDFMLTYNNALKSDFSYIHLFSYSRREGTKAVEIYPKVPERITGERVKMLTELGINMSRKYLESNLNTKKRIIIERNRSGKEFMTGKTENYLDVVVNRNDLLFKHIYDVEIVKVNDDLTVNGKIIL